LFIGSKVLKIVWELTAVVNKWCSHALYSNCWLFWLLYEIMKTLLHNLVHSFLTYMHQMHSLLC